MNADDIKLMADVALLPTIALVGWLVKRAIKGLDDKIDDIAKSLKENTARTSRHAQDIAVLKFRVGVLDGKGARND